MTLSEIIETDLQYIYQNGYHELSALAGYHVLITGGAGFLGYYLVQALLYWNQHATKKIQITVCDNFILGMPAWLKELSKEINLLECDISAGLPHHNDEFNFIIHAASIASPSFYRQYPLQTIDAVVTGLRHLLEYSSYQFQSAKNFKGLLFFSSSEIYGDPESKAIPTEENYPGRVSCIGPRACYDEAKRFGETLCDVYAKTRNLPIKIVRPFNNYGPGLSIHDRRIIADMARDILAERDIILLSDGKATRTFCYSSDAIIGYLKVLTRGRIGEAYNIGMDQPEITILELAEIVRQQAEALFYYQGKIVFSQSADENYLVHNPQRRCPNIQKARRELEFNPSVDLTIGLQRTLNWYREMSWGNK